ncbi:HEAT repeat domain-containing protein [bacterium]|nr:HEAT repeat domain-containing protein [bacterium]
MVLNLKKCLVPLLVLNFLLFQLGCTPPREKARLTVEEFTAALENYNPDTAPELRDKVLKYGELAVPFLVKSMPGKQGIVKSEFTLILEKIGQPAFLNMMELLKTENEEVRTEIVRIFEQLKPKVIDKQLGEYLTHLDVMSPHYIPIVKILVSFENEIALETLKNLLLGGDSQQRIECAHIMSELDNPMVIPLLIDSLIAEKDGRVKIYIIEALGKLKAESAIPIIEAHGLNDKTSVLNRKAAAIALGQITGKPHRYRENNSRMVYPN